MKGWVNENYCNKNNQNVDCCLKFDATELYSEYEFGGNENLEAQDVFDTLI